MEHTKGEWEVSTHGNAVYCGEMKIAVCDGASREWPNFAAVKANARLIAAAPELLAALELVMLDYQNCDNPEPFWKENLSIARAAIAKARGGA
jgi:hypothetical protein